MTRKRTEPKSDNGQQRPLDVLNVQPIAAWPWPRIVAFVPQFPAGPHTDDVFYSFWAIAQQGLPILTIPYGRTDMVRNRAALGLLRSDFTHVLMLDWDHKHPWNIVQRLARWVVADPNKLVVGGLNFRRGAPYDPCCYLLGNDGLLYPPVEWEKGLIQVDAIGTGSLLIAREVFELTEPPWFFNDYSRVWMDQWPGEDIGFSKKCREANIPLWVDTTTTSPHMIDAVVDESSYREYLADHEVVTMTVAEFQEATKQ
jgi:hypothetical protein